jgi:hypothetical protein
VRLDCHPESHRPDDVFCSICGSKISKTVEGVRVKPEFEKVLPELNDELAGYTLAQWGSQAMMTWFMDYPWPGNPLEFITFDYSDRQGYLGDTICRKGDLMYGKESKPEKVDMDSESVKRTKAMLVELGFPEDRINYYMMGDVG